MRKAVRAIEYMPYGIIQQQIMLQQKKVCVEVVFIPAQTYYFFDK
jgi:hypothetical protein